MAQVYGKVYSEVWFDTKDWPEDEKVLAFYLLTCEHASSEGLFKLPLSYAVEDMAWDLPRVEVALRGLVQREWAAYEGQWMLVVKRLRHDQPKGGPSIKGAVRKVEKAPRPSRLWSLFVAAAEEHSQEFYMALREQFGCPREAPSKGHRELSESPHEPTNTTTSTSTSSIGGGVASADEIDRADIVSNALAAKCGFDRLSVEQDRAAILHELGVRQPPEDTDWDAVAMDIRRGREAKACTAPRPVSALKWRLNGHAPLPRIGESRPARQTAADKRAALTRSYAEQAMNGLTGQGDAR